MAIKTRQHTLTIKVTFNRPCTGAHALREVRDNIHGQFYPTQIEDSDPDEFRVASFGRAKS